MLDQEPAWITTIARAVLVLALAALGLATLLDWGDGYARPLDSAAPSAY